MFWEDEFNGEGGNGCRGVIFWKLGALISRWGSGKVGIGEKILILVGPTRKQNFLDISYLFF